MVTTWDVVVVAGAYDWLQPVIVVFVLGFLLLLFTMASLRFSSLKKRLSQQKLLVQKSDDSGISGTFCFLTVLQSLQLPSSKVLMTFLVGRQ